MAEVWLMEHGLLEDAEAQADAYKRFLKSKGRAVPKLAVKKTTTVKKEPKSEVKTEAMSEEQVKPTVALDDDDSDSDVPLARRASLK
jgi:predicted RNA methylase